MNKKQLEKEKQIIEMKIHKIISKVISKELSIQDGNAYLDLTEEKIKIKKRIKEMEKK